jgi:hypothetical protein
MILDLSPLAKEDKDIVDILPSHKVLPNGCIVGTYSIRYPTGKKLIAYHGTREFENIRETEAAFTRVFLKYLGKRIVRRIELDGFYLTRPPVFVKPVFLENAVYIDLRAAFPSIYSRVGWGVDYVRGKYLGVDRPLIYPFPSGWKLGRSYVITGARPYQFSRFTYNGQIKTKPFPSPFSNPPLVALVYDVLSSIARFAVEVANCPYWNIDGGIIPMERLPIMRALFDVMGLDFSIKANGNALVINAGYWAVGTKQTARFSQGMKSKNWEGDKIPLDKKDAEWVIKRFSSYPRVDPENN